MHDLEWLLLLGLFWSVLYLWKRRSKDGRLSVGPLWLRWTTPRFNDLALSVVGRRASDTLLLFYDLGTICALCTTLISLLLLLGMVSQLIYAGVSAFWKPAFTLSDGARTFSKRELLALLPAAVSTEAWGVSLTPLIPGVTTPLALLPSFLCAILVCGVLHEAGHAVTAAMCADSCILLHGSYSWDSAHLRIDSSGLMLFFIFPGAFVSLPTEAYTSTNVYHKLRIWTGGIWHNLLLATVAVALSRDGFGTMEQLQAKTLWENRGSEGWVVQMVSPVRFAADQGYH
jgi:S2P endopeptidase